MFGAEPDNSYDIDNNPDQPVLQNFSSGEPSSE